MKSRNPNYKQYVAQKIALNKFMARLGFTMTHIGEGEMQGEMDFLEEHQQQNGWVHGGISFTVCDMVAGFASYSLVEEGQYVFTVESKISYFNPGIGQKIIAKGRVLKAGRMFHFCESEAWIDKHGEQTLMAKVSTTMAVKDPRTNS